MFAFTLVVMIMAGLPVVTAPAELTVGHGVVAAAFLAAYVAIESRRLPVQRPALRGARERNTAAVRNLADLHGGVQ